MTGLRLLQCRLDSRYDIEECLGRGSYAEIYVARDLAATDERFRKVVVKALNVLLQGDQDPELERTLIQNFQNEAIALDRVRHQNIISRLGHGTAIDLNGAAFHYLVLEYLGGGDMAALSRSEPLGLKRALSYLQQVCAGLAYAHECGVIHRDIKPQNLLLTQDQTIVKIADFGVAKIEAADGAITRVGTNVYAAPEHNPLLQTAPLDTGGLTSQREPLTPAADIYSLAKTTYALICGTAPRRFAHNPITDLPFPMSQEPWALSVLKVLARATQTRAADRYQRVQDFWDDLDDAAMPVTQPLKLVAIERPLRSSVALQPDVVAAPPQPRFETSRELRHQEVAGNGRPRPRIVVPIPGRMPAASETREYEAVQPSGRVTVAVPQASQVDVMRAAKSRKRLPAFLVALILILTFAGMLLATRNYIRSRFSQAQTQTQPEIPTGIVGREAVTVTDLNLRSGPNSGEDQIGLAEQGSRVRILNVSANTNWCEVQILQHSRTKDDPASADHGWVNKRFLRFD
jgi:eukaryotic-like serine/threonine-protein kinase